MPETWKTASLKDLTRKIGSGATPRGGQSVYMKEGVAFIRSQNVYDGFFDFTGLVHLSASAATALAGVSVQPGDTLMNITGESVTRTCIVPSDALPARVSQHVAIIRPNEEVIDPRFLHYALTSPEIKSRLNQLSAAGATRRALTKNHLESLSMTIPPLSIQKRVAGVLGALDDLIETNWQLMQALRDQIRFVYFRLMEVGTTVAAPLLEVMDIDYGGAFKGAKFSPPGHGLPLLRIRDLKTHRSDMWTTERMNNDVLVEPGDVVIGMDAEFRPTLWLGAPSLLNQRVCRVRPKIGSLAFAREALVRPMAFIEGHKTGTTVSHLNKGDLDQTEIMLPDSAALNWFDPIADAMRVAIVGLHQENEFLKQARDELLPLLLSGRVSVREVSA